MIPPIPPVPQVRDTKLTQKNGCLGQSGLRLMHSIQRTKNYLRTFTCLSATYRSSVLCGIRSTRFCRRCMPPDVPMSTTPGKEPNCFKMVSSLTDKNAATSETVSIRGSTLSAALIPPALTGALRLMEDIPTASPTTMSFSSSRSVTRPGPLRSVTFISAIGADSVGSSLQYRAIRYPVRHSSRMRLTV